MSYMMAIKLYAIRCRSSSLTERVKIFWADLLFWSFGSNTKMIFYTFLLPQFLYLKGSASNKTVKFKQSQIKNITILLVQNVKVGFQSQTVQTPLINKLWLVLQLGYSSQTNWWFW